MLLCIHQVTAELSASLYRRCCATALDWLPDVDTQPLTWLLDALHGSGFSADELLVAKGIARLLALEGKDGIWLDPKYSTIETTIMALRLLHDHGMGY